VWITINHNDTEDDMEGKHNEDQCECGYQYPRPKEYRASWPHHPVPEGYDYSTPKDDHPEGYDHEGQPIIRKNGITTNQEPEPRSNVSVIDAQRIEEIEKITRVLGGTMALSCGPEGYQRLVDRLAILKEQQGEAEVGETGQTSNEKSEAAASCGGQ
jgi:hypothetical protein